MAVSRSPGSVAERLASDLELYHGTLINLKKARVVPIYFNTEMEMKKSKSIVGKERSGDMEIRFEVEILGSGSDIPDR